MQARVLYVMGTGRSGTTVLGSLLGAAPGAVFPGELTWAPSDVLESRKPCSCGRTVEACTVWSGVLDALGWSTARTRAAAERFRAFDWHKGMLHQARASASDWAAYAEDNREIFDAVARVSGAQTVIDTSKYPARAVALSRVFAGSIDVVLLTRDPGALVRAFSRPNREEQRPKAPLAVLPWYAANAAQIAWARRTLPPQIALRYEDLCARPDALLGEVGEATGLDLADVRAGVREGRSFDVGHVVTGNRLRQEGTFVFKQSAARADDVPGLRARTSVLAMRGIRSLVGL